MAWLKETEAHLLFTKGDPQDPRLGESVERISTNTVVTAGELAPLVTPLISDSADQVHILGYPDDEGITNGGGRPGAHKGPSTIRQFLYKMTPHLQAAKAVRIYDWGDFELHVPLAERHERGRHLVKNLCEKGQKFISLGGGHDYGFADGAGFLDVYRGKAVVINLDAHLDVRPVQTKISSGTPFFRLLSDFPGAFDFFEFGLQAQCNSRHHYDWAQLQGAKLFMLDDLQDQLLAKFQSALKNHLGYPVFLSVDIDAFTSQEAPGCSQSWTTGFELQKLKPVLQWLYDSFDVRGLGIYEVSPPLDQDHRTSKLAALLAHQFIFSGVGKK